METEMKTRILLTTALILFATTALAVEQPRLIRVERPNIPSLVGFVPGEIVGNQYSII